MSGIVESIKKDRDEKLKLKASQTDSIMDGYINNPTNKFNLTGTEDERMAQAGNLSQVGVQTGQNMFQTGQQSQEYLQSLQNRRAGGDAVAANMMAQRNRTMANVGRSMAGKRVAGGVAAQALNSAQIQADESINSQLQNNARQNDNDLFSWIKRQQKVEGNALAAGKDEGLARQISVESGEGITVICTELHRQGLMDDETYHMDHLFGLYVRENWPYAMDGYHLWAKPLVKKMQKSSRWTKAVAFFALPWAAYMSGKRNVFGQLLMSIGLPMCEILGYLNSTKKPVRV